MSPMIPVTPPMDALPWFGDFHSFVFLTGITTLSTSSAAHRVVFVFQCPDDGDLEGIGFSSSSGNNQNVEVSFQDLLATTGWPDNVADQTGIALIPPAPERWAEVSPITSDGTPEGTRRTVVAGQWLGAVLALGPEAFSLATAHVGALGSAGPSLGRSTTSGTTYTESNATPSGFALKYADGHWAVPVGYLWPAFVKQTPLYGDSWFPTQIALVFRPPVTVRCAGVRVWNSGLTFVGMTAVIVRVTTGAELVSTATPPGVHPSTSSAQRTVLFPESVTLSAGVQYRLQIGASGQSAQMAVLTMPAGLWAPEWELGYSERAAGVWSAPDPTRMPIMTPLLDGVMVQTFSPGWARATQMVGGGLA